MQDKSEHGYDLTGVQSKMARAAIGQGIREIAKAAGVSPDTIARLERGEELRPATLKAVQIAYESLGVIFIPENGGGAGVRLKE